MATFSLIFTDIVSWGTIITDLIIVFLIATVILRKQNWSQKIIEIISGKAILISFVITFGAVIGSLIYSDIIGFEPCVLCWWQRIFIYPQAIFLAIALYKRDNSVFSYTTPLSVIGFILASYQTYIQFGGTAITKCASTAISCAKVYFLKFGYVSIPTMSLSVFALLLVIALIHKINKKESIKTGSL